MSAHAIRPIVEVMSHVLFISITFWGMQALRTDNWIKKHHIPQARVLIIFLTIAIGYLVSSFFMDILFFSHNIQYLT
ncbi:hypothetical protein B8A39_00720 [Dolosigranulum pigrum]|uniref:DUF1146 family protein n=1 Tax=Dolosigranulum pigrum TaxID=29394 RepID=UPI000DBFA61E|nr:DUF1146 family protein [Dolosigranulum pigrum]QTJ35120.1 DUF1146 domain-containing protein [Dolosigranulum pigrum]RAN53364.1 hypothetical protein B8A39_00720 [Dolosigranulum pigrum]